MACSFITPISVSDIIRCSLSLSLSIFPLGSHQSYWVRTHRMFICLHLQKPVPNKVIVHMTRTSIYLFRSLNSTHKTIFAFWLRGTHSKIIYIHIKYIYIYIYDQLTNLVIYGTEANIIMLYLPTKEPLRHLAIFQRLYIKLGVNLLCLSCICEC